MSEHSYYILLNAEYDERHHRHHHHQNDNLPHTMTPTHTISDSSRPEPVVKMASIMEGPLSKWTNVMKGWQYRWFVLDYNAGLLSYYTVRSSRL